MIWLARPQWEWPVCTMWYQWDGSNGSERCTFKMGYSHLCQVGRWLSTLKLRKRLGLPFVLLFSFTNLMICGWVGIHSGRHPVVALKAPPPEPALSAHSFWGLSPRPESFWHPKLGGWGHPVGAGWVTGKAMLRRDGSCSSHDGVWSGWSRSLLRMTVLAVRGWRCGVCGLQGAGVSSWGQGLEVGEGTGFLSLCLRHWACREAERMCAKRAGRGGLPHGDSGPLFHGGGAPTVWLQQAQGAHAVSAVTTARYVSLLQRLSINIFSIAGGAPSRAAPASRQGVVPSPQWLPSAAPPSTC